MFRKTSKRKIQEFYESRGGFYDQHFDGVLDDIDKAVNEFTIASLRLGQLQNDGSLDSIKLKKISIESAPQSVVNSFERHVWYSKNSLSDIWVIRVLVDEKDTFGIYISGYVDDGWDNGCILFEVYDDQGELVGSTTDGFNWEDRQFDHTDYFHQPTPPYSFSQGLETEAQVKSSLFWSDNDVLEV
jgi:hypothetical protein